MRKRTVSARIGHRQQVDVQARLFGNYRTPVQKDRGPGEDVQLQTRRSLFPVSHFIQEGELLLRFHAVVAAQRDEGIRIHFEVWNAVRYLRWLRGSDICLRVFFWKVRECDILVELHNDVDYRSRRIGPSRLSRVDAHNSSGLRIDFGRWKNMYALCDLIRILKCCSFGVTFFGNG